MGFLFIRVTLKLEQEMKMILGQSSYCLIGDENMCTQTYVISPSVQCS